MFNKVLLPIVLICFLFSSCGNKNESNMTISQSTITEQEKKIIELVKFDKQATIFDYNVDDKVKSISITCYELDHNNIWRSIEGGSYAIEGTKGRIALSFDVIENGINVSVQSEDGTTTYSKSTPTELMDTKDITISTIFRQNDADIEYDKEIPVAIQYISSGNDITGGKSFYSFEDYYNFEYESSEYDHIYSITVKFSQNILS